MSHKGGRVIEQALGNLINAVKRLNILTLIFGFCLLNSFILALVIEFDKERSKIVNSIGILTDWIYLSLTLIGKHHQYLHDFAPVHIVDLSSGLTVQ